MTDTAKQIIEIAWNKELNFWCFIYSKERWEILHHRITGADIQVNWEYTCECWWYDVYDVWEYQIIWHPIHFWHLMRLNKESQSSLARWLFDKILNRFNNNLHLYSQDCLSWDEDTNQLILDYLLTVKWAN